MKRTLQTVLGSCLAVAALVSLAAARDDAGEKLTDEKFAWKASEGGLAEVNHGMLAREKAINPDVKRFAQRMVKDHGMANKELQGLADKKGFKLAPDMGPKHKAMQEKLSQLNGEEFDRHYMHHMIEGHEKTVALFQAEAKNGKDESLRAFAEKTLPTIQEHLKMARRIHDKLKGGK
jgi:putative membrane protein